LLRVAAFQNPEFCKAQAMRLPDVREAAHHRLRRGTPSSHRPATRLSGGRLSNPERAKYSTGPPRRTPQWTAGTRDVSR
jgi:hypothetical protein